MIVGMAWVEDHHRLLGNHLRKFVAGEWSGLRAVKGLLRPIATLVGHDQLDIPTPAKGAVALEAIDGQQIGRFHAESVLIEMRDRRVDNVRRIEMVPRYVARPRHARSTIFDEGLIGGDLPRLRRTRFTF
jgi:hypothetical protein